MGDQIFSKNATAQRSEVLCMVIAYNLMRLVYFEVERGIKVEFADGVRRLAQQEWVPLHDLYARYRGTSVPRGVVERGSGGISESESL